MAEKVQRNFEALHLEKLLGKNIERDLIQLAAIGGTKIEASSVLPTRYEVNRVALSDSDFQARKYLEVKMRKAGMGTVIKHPLGLIGIYEGQDASLPPVVIESHFDSIPTAGMYDGTVGVLSAIEVVNHFKEHGIKPKRSIVVPVLTGEESSGFNIVSFGSQGMTFGLKEEELNQGKPDGQTIRQALESQGQDVEIVKKPFFEKNSLHAVIELHVSQDDRLDKSNHDLAVVRDIAAPRRFQINLGEKLETLANPKFREAKYLTINIEGKAGHSGATPMGKKSRADGFIVTSDFLTKIRRLQKKYGQSVKISIGDLTIESQAMNKIPGRTSLQIRIGGDSQEIISEVELELMEFTETENKNYTQGHVAFENNPIKINQVNFVNIKTIFFDSEKILRQYAVTGLIVRFLNLISNREKYVRAKNVATVSTFNFKEGQISLGIDIRGIDKGLRDEMISIFLKELSLDLSLNIKELTGGGDPVAMDLRLVKLAEQTIRENDIGKHIVDFSPAGHDAQNFARAGHPTVMIFIPSRNGGIAHTPEEYSTPEDLQKGAQVLASLVYNLATESN